MPDNENCYAYIYGEGRTRGGQLVKFTCAPETADKIREFLRADVYSIDIPTTSQVNIAHGGCGRHTRYNVVQHDYAGGQNEAGGGYIEVLEIKNPPEGRCGFVVNEYSTNHRHCAFSEWNTLDDAREAFKRYWSISEESFPELRGFKRHVTCGRLIPWFYAIGNEELVGDYAFPERLQDDPVFRFGEKFVVFDSDGIPTVKTCMGTRFLQIKEKYHPYDEHHFRVVYWDDGTTWDEGDGRRNPTPRPANEGELWIDEAVQQFRQLLAGKRTNFTVNFLGGSKFVGNWISTNRRPLCPEGRYYVVVNFKHRGERNKNEGWVDFKPTPEIPDVVTYVSRQGEARGYEIERIEVKKRHTAKKGKKWAGVYTASGR